jgi:hypothetical protein
MIKFTFPIVCIMALLFAGCGLHTDPPPPCANAYICSHIDDIPSVGSCCNNSPKTIVTNDHPANTLIVAILEDTLLGNVWLFDNNTQIYLVPKSSNQELGCGYRIDPKQDKCVRYKRWRIGSACFEGDKKCVLTLPQNNDLPVNDCLKGCLNGQTTCVSISKMQFPVSTQRQAIEDLYKDLLNSATVTKQYKDDILQAFFPALRTGDRETIIASKQFQSTGPSRHIQPLLPNPISFPGSTETYSKLWIDYPSVISGDINRTANQVDVRFTTSRPEFISVQVELEPSKTIRTDVIKHLYALPNQHSLVLSGDFICFKVTGLDSLGRSR